jgi:hypothetical protein
MGLTSTENFRSIAVRKFASWFAPHNVFAISKPIRAPSGFVVITRTFEGEREFAAPSLEEANSQYDALMSSLGTGVAGLPVVVHVVEDALSLEEFRRATQELFHGHG